MIFYYFEENYDILIATIYLFPKPEPLSGQQKILFHSKIRFRIGENSERSFLHNENG